MSDHKYLGRTLELSGIWFTFEPEYIYVRPSIDGRAAFHAKFRFTYYDNDARIESMIESIGKMINVGASLRATTIRAAIGVGPLVRESLGLLTSQSPINLDDVFDYNAPRFEVNFESDVITRPNIIRKLWE